MHALKGAASLEGGPTTTEHDGTGGPSFSSKCGAQAPRQAWDQTLSWICSKFIPEAKEGRRQELETSRRNARTWQRADHSLAANLCRWRCTTCLSQAGTRGPGDSTAPANTRPHHFPDFLGSSNTTVSLESCRSKTWPGEQNDQPHVDKDTALCVPVVHGVSWEAACCQCGPALRDFLITSSLQESRLL